MVVEPEPRDQRPNETASRSMSPHGVAARPRPVITPAVLHTEPASTNGWTARVGSCSTRQKCVMPASAYSPWLGEPVCAARAGTDDLDHESHICGGDHEARVRRPVFQRVAEGHHVRNPKRVFGEQQRELRTHPPAVGGAGREQLSELVRDLLMRHARRGTHDQDPVDQLVATPVVVRQLEQVIHREQHRLRVPPSGDRRRVCGQLVDLGTAARMASSGASRPVMSSTWAAAWCSSISAPPTTVAPAAR